MFTKTYIVRPSMRETLIGFSHALAIQTNKLDFTFPPSRSLRTNHGVQMTAWELIQRSYHFIPCFCYA